MAAVGVVPNLHRDAGDGRWRKGGVVMTDYNHSPVSAGSYRIDQVAALDLCRQPIDTTDVAAVRRRMKAEAVAIGVYGLYWQHPHVPNGIGIVPAVGYRLDGFDDSAIRRQANTETAIEILRDELTSRYINHHDTVDHDRVEALVGESSDGPYLRRAHAPLFMADTVSEILGHLETDPVLSDEVHARWLAEAVTEAIEEWFIDEVATALRQIYSLPVSSRLARWASDPEDGEITDWVTEHAMRLSSYDDLQPGRTMTTQHQPVGQEIRQSYTNRRDPLIVPAPHRCAPS